jgi:demethylmenaquinone methyltransferase/2-methoxy-6-polyprenyl-1,4-benzoquinol methylase
METAKTAEKARKRSNPGERAPSPALEARFAAAGDKPTYVRQMFGGIASVYDRMNRLMTGGMDGRWRDFAARQIVLEPGQVALDVGTGTGDLAIAVARHSAPGARVIGVDFTPEMLAEGREKLARMGLADRIELRQGDGARLDFPDNTFAACCSAFVVRNLADLRGGFAEMLRVVKPGGRVVCLEISHPRNRLFASLFRLYFTRVVPLLGKLIGRAFDAYTYLPTSASVFPDAAGLQAIMEQAGWEDVHYYLLTGGTVAVHVATKPA